MVPIEIQGSGSFSGEGEFCSLLHVARQVKGVLQPVPMPMAAKRRLRTDILESTRVARRADVIVAPGPSNRGLLLGAAVVLAGGIAYLLRARTRAD